MRCFHGRCALEDYEPDAYQLHLMEHIARSLDNLGDAMSLNLDALNANLLRIASATERIEADNTEAADQAAVDAAAGQAGTIADKLEAVSPPPAEPAPVDAPASDGTVSA